MARLSVLLIVMVICCACFQIGHAVKCKYVKTKNGRKLAKNANCVDVCTQTTCTKCNRNNGKCTGCPKMYRLTKKSKCVLNKVHGDIKTAAPTTVFGRKIETVPNHPTQKKNVRAEQISIMSVPFTKPSTPKDTVVMSTYIESTASTEPQFTEGSDINAATRVFESKIKTVPDHQTQKNEVSTEQSTNMSVPLTETSTPEDIVVMPTNIKSTALTVRQVTEGYDINDQTTQEFSNTTVSQEHTTDQEETSMEDHLVTTNADVITSFRFHEEGKSSKISSMMQTISVDVMTTNELDTMDNMEASSVALLPDFLTGSTYSEKDEIMISQSLGKTVWTDHITKESSSITSNSETEVMTDESSKVSASTWTDQVSSTVQAQLTIEDNSPDIIQKVSAHVDGAYDTKVNSSTKVTPRVDLVTPLVKKSTSKRNMNKVLLIVMYSLVGVCGLVICITVFYLAWNVHKRRQRRKLWTKSTNTGTIISHTSPKLARVTMQSDHSISSSGRNKNIGQSMRDDTPGAVQYAEDVGDQKKQVNVTILRKQDSTQGEPNGPDIATDKLK